jgi:mannosyltransferase
VLTLGTGWIDWIQKPSLDAIPATYAQLAGNSFLHLGAVFVLCMLALRRAAHSRRLAFGLAFTAVWAFLPVLATFAFSQVNPIFLARYFIICVPAMVLLVAGAISTLRPAPAVVAVCVLIALSVPMLRSSYEHGFPEFLGGREHDAAGLSVRVRPEPAWLWGRVGPRLLSTRTR